MSERKPNVLTVEEAALLVKANTQLLPDSDEEYERFSRLMDRLDAWAAAGEKGSDDV